MPIDAYTGRDIIPPAIQSMSKGRQYAAFGKWAWDKAGITSGVHRFYDPNENPIKEAKKKRRELLDAAEAEGAPEPLDERPWHDRIKDYPVIDMVGRSYFDVTNRGLEEKARENKTGRAADKKEEQLKRYEEEIETLKRENEWLKNDY
jgi:hypothetical protein